MLFSNVIKAEKFVRQAQMVHGTQYDYHMVLNRESLGEYSNNYININAPVFISCVMHGEFIETPHNHLQGHGCPDCFGNRNINMIKAALYEHKITAESHFTFPNVSWRFVYDLYLPDYNVIIQFHSLEHSVPILEVDGEDSFRSIKQMDVMRDALARQMGVKILYITSKHLSEMNRHQLGQYISNILYNHKYGPSNKNHF